jgi:hypothetical protein
LQCAFVAAVGVLGNRVAHVDFDDVHHHSSDGDCHTGCTVVDAVLQQVAEMSHELMSTLVLAAHDLPNHSHPIPNKNFHGVLGTSLQKSAACCCVVASGHQ